ncbi:MAG: hypothetical protein HY843_02050 [Bdellovibrio sp.]|nr:hypothetical protein [Bdellovibrio sp.]
MKINVLFAVILVGVNMHSSLADDCTRTKDQLICPGDPVVSDDRIVGRVLSVNPNQQTIVFRSDSTGNTFIREKSTMALGLGCLEMYCVRERIIAFVSNDQYIFGTILAVNPYQNTIVFRGHISGNIFIKNFVSLALMFGCVQGTCVNDSVISADRIKGTVIAVNPFSEAVALQSDETESVYIRDSKTFSSIERSYIYDDYQRSQPRFPLVDSRLYLSADIKFSLHMPQLR